MSFTKLFLAGTSLRGGRKVENPFRESRKRIVPQFTPEEQAFRFGRTAQSAMSNADLFQHAEQRGAVGEQLESEKVGLNAAARSVEEIPFDLEVRESNLMTQAVHKHKRTPELEAQSEKALGEVRVLCNDLNGADLEFARPSNARRSGTVWGWITDHVFPKARA